MHLRMTGNLLLVDGESLIDPAEGRRLDEGESSTEQRHLRALFLLDDGRELWFTDPRRFGEAFLAATRRSASASRARRASSRLGGVHAGGAGGAGRGPRRAAQVVPARPGAASPGSETSTPTRRFSARACTRSRRPDR